MVTNCLPASLPGYFYFYFADGEIEAQRDHTAGHVRHGGGRIQIWSLFPLHHQARERLGASPVPKCLGQDVWLLVADGNSWES